MNIINNINPLLRNRVTQIILLMIIILAFTLRTYGLNKVPPSLSWDEAANGYNAYTIANYGRDEYGKFFPAYFRSFADDKHPVHIYVTAFFVKLFGLSEFSTRLPSAVFGTFSVLLMYYLSHLLFKSNLIGLLASFFLAISPYHIHFSRVNHEAVFTLFFFLLGLLLFLKFLKKRGFYLPFAVLNFIFALLGYHSSIVVVPIIFLFLSFLWRKQIMEDVRGMIISLILLIFLAVLIFLNPALLGIARISQTSLPKESIENTKLFQLTRNELFGRLNLTLTQYSWHFYPTYMFITGDKNARLSAQGAGEFYKLDAILLIMGLLYLLIKRSKEGLILLIWALIAPIPSSLVAESPHAGRAMFMMGSFHLISALGLYFVIDLVKHKILRLTVLIVIVIVLFLSLQSFLTYYFNEYPKRYAIEWQYGMKQIVEYVKDHKEYSQVFMTDARSQPYIFFLYYLKYPLGDYLDSVIYNNSESNRSYNTVATFDRYYFGGWDSIESFPNNGVLYIITPSQYDGLRYRSVFDIKKVIYYPNGTTAFYLVSIK